MIADRREGSARWFASTRARLLVAILALGAALAIVAQVLIASLLESRLHDRIHATLRQETSEFDAFVRAANPDAAFLQLAQRYFDTNVLDQGEAMFAIDTRGAMRRTIAPVDLLADPALRRRWVEADLPVEEHTVYRSVEVQVRAVPVEIAGRRRGTFVVTNFLAQEASEVRDMLRTSIQVDVLGGLTFAALVWLLVGRVLRPIERVTAAAATIGTGGPGRIPSPGGGAEPRILVNTLNDMIGRLDGALSSQRQFVADAAHELRTPLTILRGHADQIASGILSADEAAAAQGVVREEITRMSRIVDDLVLLAQVEQPDFLLLAPVDLADLARGLHARALSFAGPDWRCSPGVGVAQLDAERITQAVLNLVTNAVRHSPPGAPVTIGTRLVGGEAEIWVVDSGPGFPTSRGDPGTGGRDRRPAGLGIGLRIVRAVAAAHGGRLVISDGAGAMATIVVPARGVPQ